MASEKSQPERAEQKKEELTEREHVIQSDKVIKMEREEPWPEPTPKEEGKKE